MPRVAMREFVLLITVAMCRLGGKVNWLNDALVTIKHHIHSQLRLKTRTKLPGLGRYDNRNQTREWCSLTFEQQ